MSAQIKDLTRRQQPVRARTGLVKISSGVHSLEAAIAGKSVGEVRLALKEPLNIDPRALPPGQQPGRLRLPGPQGERPAGVRPPGRRERWKPRGLAPVAPVTMASGTPPLSSR
ncbi:MAG: hypothetical protein ABSA09_06305 [Desulfobaccales bacterium]